MSKMIHAMCSSEECKEVMWKPTEPSLDMVIDTFPAYLENFMMVLEKTPEYVDAPTGKTFYHEGSIFGPTKTVETKKEILGYKIHTARWATYIGHCPKCGWKFDEIRHRFGKPYKAKEQPRGQVKRFLNAHGRYWEAEFFEPASPRRV